MEQLYLYFIIDRSRLQKKNIINKIYIGLTNKNKRNIMENERRRKMNLKLEFELGQEQLNLDYRRLGLSFIKHLIQEENVSEYERLYDKNSNLQKKYTFWMYLPNAKFTKDYIWIGEKRLELNISSTDPRFLTYLLNAALKKKNENYPTMKGGYMKLKKSQIVRTKEIHENDIIISMKSPIVVREHCENANDKYYIYNEQGFRHVLGQVLEKRFGDLAKDIVLEPVKCKKVIVKAYGTNIPASLGIFKLSGNVRLLNDLYLNGIGSKNGAGFGKFEIIG